MNSSTPKYLVHNIDNLSQGTPKIREFTNKYFIYVIYFINIENFFAFYHYKQPNDKIIVHGISRQNQPYQLNREFRQFFFFL